MEILEELTAQIPLPKMVKIRQKFLVSKVENLDQTLKEQIGGLDLKNKLKPGMSVAVAVGSRGISHIDDVARITVAELKRMGVSPFIVPCMGSHGGSTDEGQKMVLANLGVTEETMGCPIVSSMQVVKIGQLENGLPVYIDKNAYEADAIVVINRIKPHTAFRGRHESGIIKMLTIGLGKQKGADSCHAYSFQYMAENIVNMGKIIMKKANILFSVGLIENAYDNVAKIVAVLPENMLEVDEALLKEAKKNMARIMFDEFDVLIVDQIGKDVSGDGMDPNITGRYPTPYATGGPVINKVVILDLTKKTHGNANGMGMGDFIPQRLFDQIDRSQTYANALTSTVTTSVRTPVILKDDREAIAAAVKTCNAKDLSKARVIRIKDTLHLGEIWISESLLAIAKQNPAIEIVGQAEELIFDKQGRLL